jgi:hypothetical protein
VLNAFKHAFGNAENVKWEVSNRNHIAHFQLEDRQALVAFWENRNINYTILYGTDKHLPIHAWCRKTSAITGSPPRSILLMTIPGL